MGSVTTSTPLTPSTSSVSDATEITSRCDWLSFHRLWGQLGDEILDAIAASLTPLKIDPNIPIYHEGQPPKGLYILKWGTVENYRLSPLGRTHITYYNAGDLFGYAPLIQRDTSHYQSNAITLTQSELWFLSQDNLQQCLQTYPQIQQIFTQILAEHLQTVEQRLAKEQQRQQTLQPYLQSIPQNESIIGESKAARKLREKVQNAAQTPSQPLFLQGPPGSGKTFIAGRIHALSNLHNYPFAELDCAQLPKTEQGQLNSDRIFGNPQTPGLLQLLERGTVLIDNVQLLSPSDRDRLYQYLQTGHLTPNQSTQRYQSWVRLILASPHPLNPPKPLSPQTIKLFSLPQRKQDIPHLAQHFLDQYCQDRDRPLLSLNQADLRRLLSYNYPENIAELAAILKRAVIMTPPGQTTIPEQVLWSVESQKNAFRIDLLNQIPGLRTFLLSPWWPERIWILVMALFIPVTLWGWLGPESRDSSITLHFFWAWWWPFYLLLFPLAGRIWCSICPFMITGEWLRKLSLWLFPRKLRPWPTRWFNQWGAWLLFAGFWAIYLWEKLWDLPHNPALSAWLLVIITAGAIICSLIYERRLWCRYLCPIGGMNGMFAKLSMVELRSTQQICGTQCSTFGCYKGSDATPVSFSNSLPTEGQGTGGCPLYSHPAQLKDNRDCVLCMTCLKACPHRSVQLNLRFPATDLLESHTAFWAEAALLLLLFGGVFMHYSHKVLQPLGWQNIALSSDNFWVAFPLVNGLLLIPFGVTYLVHQVTRWFDPEMPSYLRVVYAYLPLVLVANLAYYTPAMMMEAGQVLPVLARSLGYSGAGLPTLTWSLDVAQFLQGVVLLTAIPFSVYPLLRITQRPLWSNLPHFGLIVGFIGVFFGLMF